MEAIMLWINDARYWLFPVLDLALLAGIIRTAEDIWRIGDRESHDLKPNT